MEGKKIKEENKNKNKKNSRNGLAHADRGQGRVGATTRYELEIVPAGSSPWGLLFSAARTG
jgi:hypothetical protein